MVTFGAVKEREYALIESGEYCLTLNELEESSGQYGDRMIWKFLVAPVNDPTNYINKRRDGSGDEKDVWVFTDPDIILGSIQHEFIEKLTGRPFSKGDAPPHEDDLIGRRIVGYITHYTPKKGKNAGTKQEQIVAGSIKAFRGPQPNAVRHPDQQQSNDDEARLKLVEEARRLIGRAIKFETPGAEAMSALPIDELSDDSLRMVIRDMKDEIQAALDA